MPMISRNDASRATRKPASLEDAETCVSMVLAHYGVEGPTPSVRGGSLLDICVALQEAGFEVTGFSASVDALRSLGTVSVMPTVERSGDTTYVACFGYESGTLLIGHPRRGNRRYSLSDFARRWPSRALLRVDGVRHGAVDRYRCFALNVARMGHNRVLVRADRNGVTRMMSEKEAVRLAATGKPRTLAAHESWLSARGIGAAPGGGECMVSESLRAWVEDGLIVSEADLRLDVARVARAAETARTDCRISSIGMPTRGRNAALERALRTYLTNVRAHDRRPTVVVASSNPAAQCLQLERRLDVLRAEFGVAIIHLDETWKRSMAHRLSAETGCACEVARFALTGPEGVPENYGANRNALLLATAGELSLQVDDDTLLPLAVSPSSSGLAVSSTFDAHEYWFDGCDWASDEGDHVDFVGLYEDLLGRHPATIIREYPADEIDVAEMDASLLRTLKRSDACIKATFLGHVGDAGTATNGWRLFLYGAPLRRLVQPGYATRISRRDGGRAAPKRTITEGLFCSGMNVGLDNRYMLPPFMPVGRNEDGVFSSVLSACIPGALRGLREGYVVRHAPVEHRSAFAYPIRFGGFRANDLIALLVSELASHRPRGLRDGFEWLGCALTDLGALDSVEWEEACRSVVYRTVGISVARIEQTLIEHGESVPELSADVRAYLESVLAFAVSDTCDVPVDLTGDATGRRAAFRSLVRRYGELLTHWPEFVRIAGYLHVDRIGDA